MRIPPKSTLTYTLLHYTTIFRSRHRDEANCRHETSHDHRTHLLGHALANRLDERHAILEPLAYRGHDNEPVEDCRSEEHTSELQSLMRNSYAVFCLKKKSKVPN